MIDTAYKVPAVTVLLKNKICQKSATEGGSEELVKVSLCYCTRISGTAINYKPIIMRLASLV